MYRRLFVIGIALAASLSVSGALALADDRTPSDRALMSLSRAPAPVVTEVVPQKVGIGDRLLIRGRNFNAGRARNVVIFGRLRARLVFVRSARSTQTIIEVFIPQKLLPWLKRQGDDAIPTLFAVRVLSRRLQRGWSPVASAAPVVYPVSVDDSHGQTDSDCDSDGIPNSSETDDDNDLIPDAVEVRIKTDPCNPDSDGDLAEDGYEFESALDINSRALPYPGKRPYPNPLDPTDANQDYDGDSLTTLEEYSAWVRYGGHSIPLNYSAGLKYSKEEPVPAEYPHLDFDGDGRLFRDDERDADKDGLANYWEAHGPGLQSWWPAVFEKLERNDYKVTYHDFDFLDPDTDGDGLVDGRDDTDFDDFDNITEIDRGLSGLWVQPFNPCLPDYDSRTCSPYFPIKPTDRWAPWICGEAFVRDRPNPLRWPQDVCAEPEQVG